MPSFHSFAWKTFFLILNVFLKEWKSETCNYRFNIIQIERCFTKFWRLLRTCDIFVSKQELLGKVIEIEFPLPTQPSRPLTRPSTWKRKNLKTKFSNRWVLFNIEKFKVFIFFQPVLNSTYPYVGLCSFKRLPKCQMLLVQF